MGKAALWVITVGTCLIYTSTDPCTHYAAVGQKYHLPLPVPKENRIRWMFGNSKRYDSKSSTNTYSVTQQGALILPKVAQSDDGTYTAETVNTDGKTNKKTLVLCVEESVPKPTVKVKCDDKVNKVQFTCSVPQTRNVKYQWLEGGKIIEKEEAAILVRTAKQLGSNLFTCKVSNPVSSETSDPTKTECFKNISPPLPNPPLPNPPLPASPAPDEEVSLFGLPFWLMVGILAGGGGLVLVLIIATIVCCSINRRKRRMHIKELRLQWSNSNHQHHHHTNQRGPAHSLGPAPSQHPSPSPRPNTATHGPTSAGHTGPRPPRARQNRPRPPDPFTGQPLPGPRRQPETGQTQIPSVNDEEIPPPLPQPRKKGPRT